MDCARMLAPNPEHALFVINQIATVAFSSPQHMLTSDVQDVACHCHPQTMRIAVNRNPFWIVNDNAHPWCALVVYLELHS